MKTMEVECENCGGWGTYKEVKRNVTFAEWTPPKLFKCTKCQGKGVIIIDLSEGEKDEG